MEDKNKKFTIAVISLAVLALVTITIWEPGQWSFRDSTDYDEQARLAQEELEMYREFLASIEPNVAASQQFLEKIATEDIVRSEVNQTLRVNQPVSVPQLANSELNISNRNDRDFMINYLTASSSMLANYRESIQSSVQEVFTTSSNPATLTAAAAETSRLITNLKEMSVPTSAVELHKASIVGLDQYAQMFTEARNYSMRTNEDPWPRLYSQYAVIDNRMAVVNSELERINRTFALGPDVELPKFSLVKTANAQFVVTVATDWQAILFDAVKTGLARAFANFSIVMLDKLVGHIEKSFAIASQLYYSNELGRFYSVEYMQRFVSDPLDQDIISKFIPEYFCIAPDGRQLRDIFVAKARDNVGNDLVINPADPDFLTKLARLGGDPKNYPLWWEGYYQSLAATTKAEADAAAAKEVLSPGVKSGRDIINNQVTKTVSAIAGVQASALQGTMNLGTSNTENIVGQLVSGVVQGLVNKFIFTPLTGGSTSGPSGIGIIQERNICLGVPQIKPLVPITDTQYDTPTTPPINPR